MATGARFSPRLRLRRGSDFRRVLRAGRRIPGAYFTMVAAEADGELSRLGLTVSRRLGGAVVRNRARRLLRESFRRVPIEGGRGFDLVLIPKAEIVGRSQAEVDCEYRERIRQLVTSKAPRSRGPRTHPSR